MIRQSVRVHHYRADNTQPLALSYRLEKLLRPRAKHTMCLRDPCNRDDNATLFLRCKSTTACYKTQVGEEMRVVAGRLVVVQNDDRHLEAWKES